MSYDVSVVGAGPAGAATATFLAQKGFRVLLLDKARFPRDKICGEALSPAALPILERMGVRSQIEAQAFPLKGVRLVSHSGDACEARYPSLPGLPDYGLALPRLILDPILVEGACRAGVVFRDLTEVSGLEWSDDRCVGILTPEGPIHSRAVVLAEGRFSKLHPRLQRQPRAPDKKRRVFVLGFEEAGDMGDLLELHLRSRGLQTVISPQGAGRATVALIITGGQATELGPYPLEGMIRLLKEDPHMAHRLRDASPKGSLKGLTLDPYFGDPLPAPGLLAVGDTTGHFDPLTGEGMYRALRSGEMVSEVLGKALQGHACEQACLAEYRTSLAAEFDWSNRFVRAVFWLSQQAGGARLAVRLLSRRPDLATLLAAYQGAMLPPQHLLRDLLRQVFMLPAGAKP